jgi:hypothetical protein
VPNGPTNTTLLASAGSRAGPAAGRPACGQDAALELKSRSSSVLTAGNRVGDLDLDVVGRQAAGRLAGQGQLAGVSWGQRYIGRHPRASMPGNLAAHAEDDDLGQCQAHAMSRPAGCGGTEWSTPATRTNPSRLARTSRWTVNIRPTLRQPPQRGPLDRQRIGHSCAKAACVSLIGHLERPGVGLGPTGRPGRQPSARAETKVSR